MTTFTLATPSGEPNADPPFSQIHCLRLTQFMHKTLQLSMWHVHWVTCIGACTNQLAGARAPPNFWQRGQGAQENLWGTCKINKKINEKAKYSAKEVFSTSSLGNGHTALINSFVDHTVFYVGADSSQTPLQFVDILYRSLVNAILNQPLYFVVDWIQVWCTRLFKIAKITLFCHINRNLSFTRHKLV